MWTKSFITARKWSLGQGNIFAPVCHSVYKVVGEYLFRYSPRQVHPRGQVHPPGRYTALGRYTPWAGGPPRQVHTPQAGTPPRAGTPPGQVHPRWSMCGRYTSYWNAFLFFISNAFSVFMIYHLFTRYNLKWVCTWRNISIRRYSAIAKPPLVLKTNIYIARLVFLAPTKFCARKKWYWSYDMQFYEVYTRSGTPKQSLIYSDHYVINLSFWKPNEFFFCIWKRPKI